MSSSALRLALLLMLSLTPQPTAAARVVVTLDDGRQLAGQIDGDSTPELLAVRHEDERILLVTRVDWNRVASAAVDGQVVSRDELRAHLAELATPRPTWFVIEENAGTALPTPTAARPLSTAAPRPVAVQIDAALANWDADAEADGLRLWITAVDAQGQPVPTTGSVSASLLGTRHERGRQPNVGAELDRWSVSLGERDIAQQVATLQLPFQRIDPLRDEALLPDAVLTVRFSARGAGTLAASVPVCLRPLDPLRDQLQQQRRGRVLPGEYTGPDRGLGDRHGGGTRPLPVTFPAGY